MSGQSERAAKTKGSIQIYEFQESPMLANYFPVLLFIAIGVVMGLALLTAGRVIGPSRPNVHNF